MRIPCPFCGERSSAEFAYLGDAAPQRPDGAARNLQASYDYVYTRQNPPGILHEYWQHTGGCRSWLVVERNVTTHDVVSARPARRGAAAPRAQERVR